MVNLLKKRRGYSIIEMMVVVAIIGSVIVAGPLIMTQLIRFYQLHNAKIEIQRDARACLDIINRYLRQASAASVVIDQVTSQAPFSRIRFSTVGGQNIIFYQSGNSLYQVDRSTSIISKNLRYIAFTYPRSDDPTIISVAMTMEKSTYQGASKALELSIEKVRVMN